MNFEPDRGLWRKLTREILEQVPVGILVVDDKMRVRFLNRTTERFALASGLAVDREHVLGSDFETLFPGHWPDLVRKSLEKGKRYDAKSAMAMTQGAELLFHCTVSAIFGKDNQMPIATVVTLQDVSEAEHRLQQMAKDAQRFDHLWMSSCELMIALDERSRIVDFNMAAEEALGFFKEHMIGKALEEYLPIPRDAQFLRQVIREGGYLSSFETQLQTKSGGLLDVSLTLATLPHGDNGSPKGTLVIGRDISKTARLKTEIEEIAQELGDVHKELHHVRHGLTKGLSFLMERMDGCAFRRAARVVKIARGLALFEGMDDDDVQVVEEAALLSRLGRLVYGLAEGEPCGQLGAELLRAFGAEEEKIQAVLYHQEWYDGGQGEKEAGEEHLIPLAARIIAIAEAFIELQDRGDSMSHTLTVLEGMKGKRLDPVLVEDLIELYRMDELH